MVENEKPRPRRTPFLLFTVFLLCGILALPGFALAENHTDPAPYIEPTSSNGYRVLFDNTHGQTAGAADWVIDLGPDAGNAGGEVVFEGTPEELVKQDTYTAKYI